MSSMLLAASVGNKFNRTLPVQLAGKNLAAGQVWIIAADFLALRSTTDRIVGSDPTRPRFKAVASVGWRLIRFAYGCVVLQYGDGSPEDSKAGTYLYLRREELLANGTCSAGDQADVFGAGLYRVLSASGRVLGNFDDQALASAAMRHWAQAVSVVCGSRVIERKGELPEFRAA